jgi:hypothetical protein
VKDRGRLERQRFLREKKSKHKWLRLEEEEEEEEEDLDLVQLLSKQRVGSPISIVASTSLFLILLLLLPLFVYSSEGLRKKARSLGYLCSLFSLRHRSQAGRCLLVFYPQVVIFYRT